MQNADLTATGGQTILATDGAGFEVSASKTLSLSSAAKVGFDGQNGGIAILDLHDDATLAYLAQDGDLGTIAEFRSGAFGSAPDVQSGVNLGNSELNINLAGLSASAGTAFTLMDVDELVGVFENAVVGGLGSRNATIVIDYQNDSVTLQLSAGNGAVNIQTVGQESDVTTGEDALWAALTNGQGVQDDTIAASIPGDVDDIYLAA
jgi:hypothetical protein